MSNIVYRDYGAVGDNEFPNNQFTSIPRRQVYKATHGGDDSRLPLMNRSFISFSYGGKWIEEFNLIATIEGDRMNRDGYSSFDDITSSYDNLDGQQYWSTHYKTNTIDFSLATDGMDQRDLDDFLYWFSAGVCRELILAEHPNRAQLARVSNPPELRLLPFEQEVTVMASNHPYKTKTTLYKGEINLKFVMDQPHWYSVTNILGKKNGDRYIDMWDDINGEPVSIFASQDALKILYEDGIPLGSMIVKNMLLGNGSFAKVDKDISSCIWDEESTISVPNRINPEGESLAGGGACIDGTDENNVVYKGIIAGALIDADGNGMEEIPTYDENNPNTCAYFFYSGTAPAPTIISFTLTPKFDDGYIVTPCNSKTDPPKYYNTLTIEGLEKQELQFTTPNILTSFNKAVEIFDTYMNGQHAWEEIHAALRDNVRHQAVREWANGALTTVQSSQQYANVSLAPAAEKAGLISSMSNFLKDSNNTVTSMKFTFNSETGEAIGEYQYRALDNSNLIYKSVEEDVGDMLRSNYLIIRDRNYPTEDGSITQWTEEHKEYSHRIYHDCDIPLKNVTILYKNMYL